MTYFVITDWTSKTAEEKAALVAVSQQTSVETVRLSIAEPAEAILKCSGDRDVLLEPYVSKTHSEILAILDDPHWQESWPE